MEDLIGFTDVSAGRTFSHVGNIVQEFQIAGKLIRQTYDEASVMCGHVNGLQREVLNTCHQPFVHFAMPMC
jgi:hypothetical protein